MAEGTGEPRAEQAGARTAIVRTMSSASDNEEVIDKREVLIHVLRNAIPTAFRKEETDSEPPIQSKKRWRASEQRSPEKKPVSVIQSMSSDMGSVIRKLDREKNKEAERQIASLKKSGTRWWKEEKEEKEVEWFDMPSSEINEEVQRDLEVLSMRGAFHPKRHYKNLDGLKDAKWIQVGTVMDNPVEGAKGRLPNRIRKRRTLTQQWMADDEMGKALQKRYLNISAEEEKIDNLRAKQYPLMHRRTKRRR